MEFLWIVAALAALPVLVWAVDLFRNRHPLTAAEVEALARKRQRNEALRLFGFSAAPLPADPSEKKAMQGSGEFVPCDDVPFRVAPARIAGLLKGKKHEWIVLAFISEFRVRALWWNKGPDGTRVWSLLDDRSLAQAIESLQADTIAQFHNHPNPDPRRLRTNVPSDVDLRSAASDAATLGAVGLSLLDFVCERGVPHLYYARFSDRTVPMGPFVREILSVNGRSVFRNYRLRRELRRRTRADLIAGGTS